LATAAMDAYPPFEWIDVATKEHVAAEIHLLRDDVDRRFDDVDRRFDDVDRRFDDVARRLDRIAGRFERVDTRFERIDAEFVRVRGEMALGFARQTRMMVYGFVATIVANAGVVAAIVGAGS
jgi:hypothetical protein